MTRKLPTFPVLGLGLGLSLQLGACTVGSSFDPGEMELD